METALGLFGLLLVIAVVIALAAAVTFTVVKLTPSRRRDAAPEKS